MDFDDIDTDQLWEDDVIERRIEEDEIERQIEEQNDLDFADAKH